MPPTRPSLPSPLSTPSPSPNALPDATLVSRLDSLLAEYLSLLDTYSTLRQQLSSDFSSGFLALAHANRNATSTLGAGRRYGEEGFDGRMKATRGVRIQQSTLRLENTTEESETKEKKTKTKTEVINRNNHNDGEERENEDDERSTATPKNEAPADTEPSEPNPKATVPVEIILDKNGDGHNHSQLSNPPPPPTPQPTFFPSQLLPPTPQTDPLRWHGLFTPLPLRQCQSAFTASITGTIPSLLSTTSQMRTLEEDIWTVREALGILDQYSEPGRHHTGGTSDSHSHWRNEDEDEAGRQTFKSNETGGTAASSGSTTSATNKKGLTNLVSRSTPAEPRSRVLKID